MKRSMAWKSGVPTTGSTCCGSTGAGRIAIGGMGARSFRRTYALSRIRPRCVRGLLSHNDNDPLQQISFMVSVPDVVKAECVRGGSEKRDYRHREWPQNAVVLQLAP